MSKKTQKFPSKTRRNSAALTVAESFEQCLRGAKNGVWVAGRIVGILDDGFVVQDQSGRLDVRWEEKVRVGDIVEVRIEKVVEGGEQIFVGKEMEVLVPCNDDFFIPPTDANYRRTVIDRTLMNVMEQRVEVLDGIREYFKKEEFLEVETPEVVRLPGMEPYLDVFGTEFVDMKGESEEMFLITSPEYAMKKLLVAGYEKVFQICKSFRNKETDSQLHNPEFTLLEWYRGFADYEAIMEDTEKLVEALAVRLHGEPKIKWNGKVVDVNTPWPRVTVVELFEQVGIERAVFENFEKFVSAVAAKGYNVGPESSYEDVFFSVFLNEIEPNLGMEKPVIVKDYPVEMAALAKRCEDDDRYAQRFEAYVAGMELCNAFTELNDPIEQKERLEMEREERQKLGKRDYPVDQSFIRALELGMPPSGGNALGVDRLVMLLTNTPDIRDVLFFPHKDL
ncbi:EF-P lysine aminoacylase GenX [Candidatus Peregrinibacteria bacterium]|nr:EF-P lysine aminoacylase GenX [Candidatus Peregrinibacteria bacterium]